MRPRTTLSLLIIATLSGCGDECREYAAQLWRSRCYTGCRSTSIYGRLTRAYPGFNALLKGEAPWSGVARRPLRLLVMSVFALTVAGMGISLADLQVAKPAQRVLDPAVGVPTGRDLEVQCQGAPSGSLSVGITPPLQAHVPLDKVGT